MSTIHEYAELLKQRKLSSVELTKQYLARIEKAARSGGTEQSGRQKICNYIITESEDLSNDN